MYIVKSVAFRKISGIGVERDVRKHIKILSFIFALLMLPLCTSCKKNDPTYSAGDSSFHAEVYRITDENGVEYDDEKMQSTVSSARDVFNRSLELLSNNSDIMGEINSDVDVILDCDGEILDVLNLAVQLCSRTNGGFQPCGGAYTALYSGGATPDEESITEALTHIGTDKFEISETSVKKLDRLAAFDLYAVSEGYAMQKAVESFGAVGVECGTLTSKNTVAVFGAKPKGDKFNIAIPGDDGYIGWFCVPRGYVAYIDSDSTVYDFGGGTNEFKRIAVYAADGMTAAALANAIWIGGTEYETELSEGLGGSYCMVAEKNSGEIITSTGAVESGLFVFRITDKKE